MNMDCASTYLWLISFSDVLQFSGWFVFFNFLKLISEYFILCDAIVNETVFLASFSDCLMLIYRNVL